MAGLGLLVHEWPLVVAVDASGVIVESSSEAEAQYNLRPGDYVCGCTRLGMIQYASGQEYFLMDAAVTIPKPKNIDLVQAATLGVGIDTAALGIFQGLKCELPEPNSQVNNKDEWVVILGGASSVGSYAVQLARAAGYKVIASCSTKSADAVKSFGAETFDYRSPIEQQVDAVVKVTGEQVNRIFDAAASDDPVIAKELFKRSKAEQKYFATTNDWSGITDFHGGKTYLVKLGPVGRPEATELNEALKQYIPMLVKLVESGKVKTNEYQVFGKGGFEDVIGAYKHKVGGGGGSSKVVVKVQDE